MAVAGIHLSRDHAVRFGAALAWLVFWIGLARAVDDLPVLVVAVGSGVALGLVARRWWALIVPFIFAIIVGITAGECRDFCDGPGPGAWALALVSLPSALGAAAGVCLRAVAGAVAKRRR